MIWSVACLSLVACGWFARALMGSPVRQQGVAPRSVPSVAVASVAEEVFNPPEEFVGHVEPVQEVDILPQIEGYIKDVAFSEGDEVKAGDLLFTIDDERYRADYDVAAAERQQAKSRVVQAEAALERSERYLSRIRAVDARGITQTEKDQAETQFAVDQAALGAAKAAVSQADARLARMAFDLRHTSIRAPISGRIGKTLRHAGDYVSPTKGALARIVQLDPVRVTFPVTDRAYLSWGRNAASKGTGIGDSRRLRLKLADGTLYSAVGSWLFSDNAMSPDTATLLVRAQFPNPSRTLLPNAYVTVLADEANPAPVPVVPLLAVVTSGASRGAWIFDKDEEAVHFRPIEIEGAHGGLTRVVSGLKAGETIVVQGVHKLGEGMHVRIVPASDFH